LRRLAAISRGLESPSGIDVTENRQQEGCNSTFGQRFDENGKISRDIGAEFEKVVSWVVLSITWKELAVFIE